MSRTLRTPTTTEQRTALEARVYELERRISEQRVGAADSPPEVLWAVNGALALGRSNNYDVPAAYTLLQVILELGTAGSTKTTISIRKNGSTVIAWDIAAGATIGGGGCSVPFGGGDKYSVAITGVGTGAANLQTQARFG